MIILFDGVCNLCNATVQFIIRRDSKGVFRFASLQSEAAQNIMKRFGLNTEKLYTVIVVDGDQIFQKSDAALRIAARLDGVWSSLRFLKVVPRIIRDFVYDRIARNRYKMFGKQNECMIPTPELKSRFL